MTKSLAITCAGILAVCLLGSCSTERDPRDLLAPGGIGVPVIDALLVVGQPLPDIFLTRTIAPDETFNTTRALIARAHVVVTDVAAGTDVIYGYSETTGRYIAPTSPFPTLVEPNTEYRIAITTQEGETLTASTVTPPSLAVADWLLLGQGQSTGGRCVASGTRVVGQRPHPRPRTRSSTAVASWKRVSPIPTCRPSRSGCRTVSTWTPTS
ncbi:MAG: hypothetical protein R3E12_04100 [Candidatus Eisenbacteria bacterium]